MLVFELGTPTLREVLAQYTAAHHGDRSAAKVLVRWRGEPVAEVQAPAARAAFPALVEAMVGDRAAVDVEPALVSSWPQGSVRRTHLEAVLGAVGVGVPGSVAFSRDPLLHPRGAPPRAPIAHLSDVPALANLCGFLGSDWAIAPILASLEVSGPAVRQAAAHVARALVEDVATREMRRVEGPLALLWEAAARAVRTAGGVEDPAVRAEVFGDGGGAGKAGLDVASLLELHRSRAREQPTPAGVDGPAITERGAHDMYRMRDRARSRGGQGVSTIEPFGTDWLDPVRAGTLDLLGDAFQNECRWAAERWAAAPGSPEAVAAGDAPRRSVAELGRALEPGAPFSATIDVLKARAALALGDLRGTPEWPWAPAWHADLYRAILEVDLLA